MPEIKIIYCGEGLGKELIFIIIISSVGFQKHIIICHHNAKKKETKKTYIASLDTSLTNVDR